MLTAMLLFLMKHGLISAGCVENACIELMSDTESKVQESPSKQQKVPHKSIQFLTHAHSDLMKIYAAFLVLFSLLLRSKRLSSKCVPIS